MSNYTPPRPTGTNSEARYHQAVWDRIFGQPMFINTPACKWRKVGGSYIPEIKFPAASSEPDHPFKIKRLASNSFQMTPGKIDCPLIWPYNTTRRQPTFYGASVRFDVLSDSEISAAYPNGVFGFPEDSIQDWDVWFEITHGEPRDGTEYFSTALRIAAGGERLYHAGGLSGFNSEFKLVVPIGTVSTEEIVQYALGHQTNRINTGQMRWCGEYSDIRIYYPGDVVRKNIASSGDPDWQTFLNRGDVDSGWDKQLCSIGIAPQDGTLGYDTWQRLTPPDSF